MMYRRLMPSGNVVTLQASTWISPGRAGSCRGAGSTPSTARAASSRTTATSTVRTGRASANCSASPCRDTQIGLTSGRDPSKGCAGSWPDAGVRRCPTCTRRPSCRSSPPADGPGRVQGGGGGRDSRTVDLGTRLAVDSARRVVCVSLTGLALVIVAAGVNRLTDTTAEGGWFMYWPDTQPTFSSSSSDSHVVRAVVVWLLAVGAWLLFSWWLFRERRR